MISNLAMAGRTASLTTISTPHLGSPLGDLGLAVIPDWLQSGLGLLVNALGVLLYQDDQQDIMATLNSVSVATMGFFNQNVPNHSAVSYFSYGNRINIPDPIQHPFMFLMYPVTLMGGQQYNLGEANDGVVPVLSMKWGAWMGEMQGYWYATGVDHTQATNFMYGGQTYFDVEGYYLTMAQKAKNVQ
jgi:triacylglycerol lipase